jgi:putative flippase GtrA
MPNTGIKSESSKALSQAIRFGLVGIFNNLLGYIIYLILTWLWIEPKVAVTLFYPLGALIGFQGQARFAFSYRGSFHAGISRYVLAHLTGYCLNILFLWYLSDILEIPHQLVQLIAIFLVASFLFLAMKYYVFAPCAY